MQSFEEQWSIALKKGKQQAGKKIQVSLDIQKKQWQEENKYFREALIKSIKTRAKTAITNNFKALINLRARQVGFNIRNRKEKFGFASDNFIKGQAKKYYMDCYKLRQIVQKSLS